MQLFSDVFRSGLIGRAFGNLNDNRALIHFMYKTIDFSPSKDIENLSKNCILTHY